MTMCFLSSLDSTNTLIVSLTYLGTGKFRVKIPMHIYVYPLTYIYMHTHIMYDLIY